VSTFVLQVDIDNAAFWTEADRFNEHDKFNADEVARILRAAADVIAEGDTTRGACRDVNGNAVGTWRFAFD
jgi:hypothetical protein